MPARLTHDEAAAEMLAAGFEPLEPYPGTAKPWRLVCLSCGEEAITSRQAVNARAGSCRGCARKDAEATMVAAGFTPLEPYPGAKNPWRCICPCGRETSPSLQSVAGGNTKGCRGCYGSRSSAARIAAKAERAVQDMLGAGITPLEPYPGTGVPWRCICLCGRETTKTHNNVMSGSRGCKRCADKTSHRPTDPEQVMLDYGFTPLEPYPGNGKKPWRCRCRCGQVVSPTRNNVLTGKVKACNYCTTRGFDYNEPGVLYLLVNDEWNAAKVGITNTTDQRIRQHESTGWTVYRTWRFNNGADTHAAEQLVLDYLRSEGVHLGYVDRAAMPQGGWTETWSQLQCSVNDAAELITGLR